MVPKFASFRDFLAWVYTALPRRGSAAGWLADAQTMRDALTLCQSCQGKMGLFWERRLQYRAIHRYAAFGNCDGCQKSCTKADPATLFVPEEQGYWQEHVQIERIETAARAQAVEIRDRRRVLV